MQDIRQPARGSSTASHDIAAHARRAEERGEEWAGAFRGESRSGSGM